MWQNIIKLESKYYILGNEFKFKTKGHHNTAAELVYEKQRRHFPIIKKVIEGVYEKIKRTPIDNIFSNVKFCFMRF